MAAMLLFGTLSVLLLGAAISHAVKDMRAERELNAITPVRTPAPAALPSPTVTATEEAAEEVEAAPTPTPRVIMERYRELYEKNSDLTGWLYIEDTPINYPVMFTPEEPEAYLHANFEREYEYRGLPFLDARCDIEDRFSNLIIYGHNMKNGSMFHSLLNYESAEYLSAHPYILLDTLYEERVYRVFAACRTRIPEEDSDEFRYYRTVSFATGEEFARYIDDLIALSLHEPPFTPEYGAQLVILSTCAYHEDEGRFIVAAQRIK